MSSLALTGGWARASAFLSELQRAQLRPTAPLVTAVLASFHPAWPRGLRLFSQLQEVALRPDAPLMNAAIGLCAAGQAWQSALGFLHGMLGAGPRPTVESFNAAASACASASHWKVAVALLPAMADAALAPDVVSISAVLHAYELAMRWPAALGLLRRSQASSYEPGLVAFNTTAAALGKSARWEAVFELFGELEALLLQPSEVTYNVCMNACLHGQQWAHSLALLPAAQLLGVHDALGACERAGKLRAAQVAMRSLQRCASSRLETPGGSPVSSLRGLDTEGIAVRRLLGRREHVPVRAKLIATRGGEALSIPPAAAVESLGPTSRILVAELCCAGGKKSSNAEGRKTFQELWRDCFSFSDSPSARPGPAAVVYAVAVISVAAAELFQLPENQDGYLQGHAAFYAAYLIAACLPLIWVLAGLRRRRIWQTPPVLLAATNVLPCISGVLRHVLWSVPDSLQYDLLKVATLHMLTALLFPTGLLVKAVSLSLSTSLVVAAVVVDNVLSDMRTWPVLVEASLLYLVLSLTSLAAWSPADGGPRQTFNQAVQDSNQQPLVSAALLRQRLIRQLNDVGYKAEKTYNLSRDMRSSLSEVVSIIRVCIERSVATQDAKINVDVSNSPAVVQARAHSGSK
eukprot:s1775_g1.t1